MLGCTSHFPLTTPYLFASITALHSGETIRPPSAPDSGWGMILVQPTSIKSDQSCPPDLSSWGEDLVPSYVDVQSFSVLLRISCVVVLIFRLSEGFYPSLFSDVALVFHPSVVRQVSSPLSPLDFFSV